jgi:hypothetical protein
MTNFTDLLDNYLLALGIHNQAHALHEHDPLRFAEDFREATAALKTAKDELNGFVNSLKESIAGLVEP